MEKRREKKHISERIYDRLAGGAIFYLAFSVIEHIYGKRFCENYEITVCVVAVSISWYFIYLVRKNMDISLDSLSLKEIWRLDEKDIKKLSKLDKERYDKFSPFFEKLGDSDEETLEAYEKYCYYRF